MSEFCFERNEWLSFTIKNPDVYLAMINDPVKENALHTICFNYNFSTNVFFFFIYTAVVQGTLVSASTGIVIAAIIRKILLLERP